MKCLSLIILVTFQVAYSQINQSGMFRSQATQGKQWWGTSKVVSEHFTIKVMPSYIDVTLDWELDCKGATEPDSFKDALEIQGNITLASNAAVTGLLLWNGDEIIKAKLKPLPLARQQYESVVNRNVMLPPRPKDPLLFEYGWGKDNYDFKIFPVSFGKTRRLRLRYVVPAINFKGCADIPFPSPFDGSKATYTIVPGANVSKVMLLDIHFEVQSEKTELSATSDSELLKKISVIRPVISNPDSASVIFAAPIKTTALSGTLVHFTGQTSESILKKNALREDIVFLWRWNHAEYFDLYKKQIVIQAGLLRKFFANIHKTGRQAGLVVDMQGMGQRAFPIGKYGSIEVNSIITYLDSLWSIEYVENDYSYEPKYTQRQQDSIVSVSISEFLTALRLAESLFLQEKTILKKIVFLTAGPCWVYRLKADIDLQWTTSASLAPITGIQSCEEFKSIPIPDAASWFHWPGISLSTVDFNQTKIEVILKLDDRNIYNKSIPFTQRSYYDRYSLPPYHDISLFISGNVLPEVVWNVYQGWGKVATFTEKATMVIEEDASQFGVSLAGTGRLQAYATSLPTPLATAFGFVDQRYALLALEDDTMSVEDQILYRNQGVPPLGSADILNLPVDSILPKDDTFGRIQVPVNPKNSLKPQRERKQPSVTYHQSVLTIQLNSEASKASNVAEVEIFSLSGKLLHSIKNIKMISGVISCRLPSLAGFSQKMVIVKIRCGKVAFSRVFSMQ